MWFDPTDVIQIPAGTSIAKEMARLGYHALLMNDVRLVEFLQFNGISSEQFRQKLDRPVQLFGHHRVFYERTLQENPMLATHRTRSYSLFDQRTQGLSRSLNSVMEQLQSTSHVSILEIGCGNGRLLLELSQRLPQATLHGIGKFVGEDGFEGTKSLNRTAELFELETPVDESRFTFHFTDLSDGNLGDIGNGPYDLILSQATIRYFERKDRLVEEMYRKLKLGGMAFFDLQLMNFRPARPASDVFSAPVFEYDSKTNFVMMRKLKDRELKLGLTYLPAQSWHEDWNSAVPNLHTVGWNTTFE